MSQWLGVGQVSYQTWKNISQKQQLKKDYFLSKDFFLLTYKTCTCAEQEHDDNNCLELQTIVEVVPNIPNPATNAATIKDGEGDYHCPLMKLHPHMEEFLLLSCQAISNINIVNNDKPSDRINLIKEEENEHVMIECVLKNQDDDDDDEEFYIHRDIFTLKPIAIHDMTQTTNQIHLSLQFIYSTNNAYNDYNFKKEQMQQALVGRVVAKYCIVALPSLLPSSNHYLDCNEDEVVMFFKIKDVICKKEENGEETTYDENRAYQLGIMPNSFTLSILHDDETKTTTSRSKRAQTTNPIINPHNTQQTLTTKTTEKISYCPGYESILEKLHTLLTLPKYHGGPSGVILHGCAGVGKTTLASCLVQNLLYQNNNNNNNRTNIMVCSISAKDVLLNYASSSLYSTSTTTAYSKDDAVSNIIDDILDREDNYVYSSSSSGYSDDDEVNKSNDSNDTSLVERKNNNNRIDGILVMDDLDVIANLDNENNEEDETLLIDSERIVTLHILSTLMDKLQQQQNQQQKRNIIMIGICRCAPHTLPKRIIQINKLEKHVEIIPPTQKQREVMLYGMLKDLSIRSSCFQAVENEKEKDKMMIQQWSNILAMRTAGCVASDLKRLCVDAYTRACARSSSVSSSSGGGDGQEGVVVVDVTWDDLKLAALSCIPSQLAELDVTTVQRPVEEEDDDIDSDVNDEGKIDTANKAKQANIQKKRQKRRYDKCWNKFGGYSDARDRIYRTVVLPWRKYAREGGGGSAASDKEATTESETKTLKLSPPSGVIFHGPPGVGKTLAVDCLAMSLELHVVKVRASDILDKWLGGSESAIRSLFARARSASPCILFFDEIDALACNREDNDGDDGGSDVHSRILSTLLNEMDGVSSSNSNEAVGGGVLVVAATNRMDAIDAALLRPGRLEEHVLLDLPSVVDIEGILKIHTAKMPLKDDVDLRDFAEVLFELGANGAVVEGICREACLITIRNLVKSYDADNLVVPKSSFEEAICRWKRF